MTPPVQKLDPSQIEKFPSLQIYTQQCQAQAGREGKTFDVNQALVANRASGDGRLEILGSNPDQDLYCSAQLNWFNHEMLIDSGSLSKKDRKPVGALWMTDACSLTRALAGEEELNDKPCQDGLVDSRVPPLSQMDSMQFFLKTCNQQLKTHGEKIGRDWDGQVQPNRVFLENPMKGDGVYSLMFVSGAYQFACEGMIDTLGHNMIVSSGSPNDEEKRTFAGGQELVDDCTLTRKALGEGELMGPCQDRTKAERETEDRLTKAFHLAMMGLAARDIYLLIRKRPTILGKVWRVFRHPIQTWRAIPGAFTRAMTALRSFPSNAWTALRSFPSNAWSRAGAALSAIPTAFSTLRALGGLRAAGFLGRGASFLPAFLGGGLGAAGGGTTVAAGGGTVAAAGVGVTAGAVALGLGIGIGIGTLIEYVPRWCGAKKSVSDGVAWGIEGVSKFVTGDEYGFVNGGWNGFKKKWFGWM